MSIVITNQVEASEKSVNQLEAELRREHHSAMLCFDVQDLLRSVVSIYSNINADVERWQSRSAGAPSESELEEFETISVDLYQRLEFLCDRTFKLVQTMETIGFSDIPGKKEFLEVWRGLRIISLFPIEKVKRAVRQIRVGKMRSLAEVRDELWDSPVR